MNLMEAINTRRSVRKFTDEKVKEEQIQALLEAAVQAPSASNLQPWAFGVIQEAALLQQYSDTAKTLLLSVMADNPRYNQYRQVLSNPDYNIFYNAATLVVIYANDDGFFATGDCCLAAQNLMLAAHGMGLGTCWIGFARELMNQSEVKSQLGIPETYTAVAPIIVGYPERKSSPIKKKAPKILFWK